MTLLWPSLRRGGTYCSVHTFSRYNIYHYNQSCIQYGKLQGQHLMKLSTQQEHLSQSGMRVRPFVVICWPVRSLFQRVCPSWLPSLSITVLKAGFSTLRILSNQHRFVVIAFRPHFFTVQYRKKKRESIINLNCITASYSILNLHSLPF